MLAYMDKISLSHIVLCQWLYLLNRQKVTYQTKMITQKEKKKTIKKDIFITYKQLQRQSSTF